MKKCFFNPKFQKYEAEIKTIINSFYVSGNMVLEGDRNMIKKFKLADGLEINVKSFKKPHLVNKITYRYLRASKAERSFKYASKLVEMGIGTPSPLAYVERMNLVGLKESFYVSEHLNYDFTFRELIQKDWEDREEVLKQFTKFTFNLHENGIHFLDHSPGNTLIIKSKDKYDFYLVDLNRMEFLNLDLKTKLMNFRRLSASPEMIEIMAKEYARLTAINLEDIWKPMQEYTDEFQRKFQKKMALKTKYLGRKYK